MPSVLIVGGGLAGIAAAVQLRQYGCEVTLLEARPRLGGRATSYTDQESGQTIDNCQHVSMGCCTNLTHFCQSLGIADQFSAQKRLYFVGPEGSITPFQADPLPAPFHLTRSFFRLPYLTFREKGLFASAIRALVTADAAALSEVCFEDWLRKHQQTEPLIRYVWEVVLVSALSESLDRINAAYARKVFVDGFLANTRGWQVLVPTISLDELYSERVLQDLTRRGVQLKLGCRSHSLRQSGELVTDVMLKDGTSLRADEFILAVPHHQLISQLSEAPSLREEVSEVENIESAPITSVHLWFDRPITELPHAVLLGRLSQWMFNRGRADHAGKSAWLFQVVISASRNLQGMSPTDTITHIHRELSAVWPIAEKAELLHGRVITERRAVFSARPGVDSYRFRQQSSLTNLQFAGDWTQTGWPATMEGAVRSGYLAAENILRRAGHEVNLVQPNLPTALSAHWILKIPRGTE